MLSPIFPSLLTFILLIVYKIYFEPAILCDNGSYPLLLDQLERNLREEKNIQSVVRNKILEFNAYDTTEVSSDRKAWNKAVLISLQEKMTKSLNRSKEIEDSIKKIDPTFVSGNEGIIRGFARYF